MLIWLQKVWLDLYLLQKVVGADLAAEGAVGTDLAAVEGIGTIPPPAAAAHDKVKAVVTADDAVEVEAVVAAYA